MTQLDLFGESMVTVVKPAHPKGLKADPHSWANLPEVAACVANCTLCPLSRTRTQTVFASGNPQARLMLIGEAPGQQEDETGKPFVGRAGQLLTQLLQQVGLDRDRDLYIANTVKCRPPENRKPLPAEMATCRGYLEAQLAFVQPKIILLAGSTAVEGVLGLKQPITKLRGQWQETGLNGVQAMPIFHPSYLLRNPSSEPGTPKALTLADLKTVHDRLRSLSPA